MLSVPGTDSALYHPISKDVVFQLFGRRTLSEQLPAESIKITASSITRSLYLRNFVSQHVSPEQGPTTLELRDIDPAGFRLYVEWLESGKITFTSRSQDSASLGLALHECIDLMYAHIAGSHFHEPDFQDYTIDEIEKRLDSAQLPDVKPFQVIFVDKGASSTLKRFVVDKMFAQERKMLGKLKGFDRAQAAGCEYHVHEEEACYRNGKGAEKMPASKVNDAPWSADDDPDLQATAAYYLKKPKETAHLGNVQPLPLMKEDPNIVFQRSESSASALRPRRSSMYEHTGSPQECERAAYNSPLHDFVFPAWSRNIHGLATQRRPATPHPKLEKPLPPVPSELGSPVSFQTRASLPPHPRRFSVYSPPKDHPPARYLESAENHHLIKNVSIQGLVLECLGRLTPKSKSRASKVLVNECLERLASVNSTFEEEAEPILRPNSLENIAFAESPSPTEEVRIPRSLRPGNLPSVKITRKATLALSPTQPYPWPPVHGRPTPSLPHSHPPSPYPAPYSHTHIRSPSPSPSLSPPQNSLSYPLPSTSSPPPILEFPPPYTRISSPNLPPLIKRKPAPPRGQDWIEQWDRLDAMRGTQGFGMRRGEKTEKRSRLREMVGR